LSSGFFALLDDIAILMDDVSSMTQQATKNTAAILGDDLAVNAAKASDFAPSRELPVIWKITKGSILNKIILTPLIIALNYYFPVVVKYLLIIGALFLSYEGAHALWGYFFPNEHHDTTKKLTEKQKVKSAIVTDFILSIEIILIALYSVQEAPFVKQAIVVFLVALAATVGVYSLVALLVRVDDFGAKITNSVKEGTFGFKFGNFLIKSLPIIIKILSIIGTFAMLLVAGSIFMHQFHIIADIMHQIPNFMANLITAIIAGGAVMSIVNIFKMLKK